MSEREALYAAVCAEPWADLPRLVFADWLDDHGEPDRAAFIRTEVELARHVARGGWGSERPELMDKRSSRMRRYGQPPAAPVLNGVTFLPVADRGFAAGVLATTVEALAEHAETARRTVPLTLAQVLGRSKRRAAGFAAVAGLPLLGQVRELRLYRVPIGDAGAAALARSNHLYGLRHLDLRHIGLTDAGIRALVAAPWFPTLQTLDIDANPYTASGVETLLALGAGCDLTHFRLTNWRELFGEIVPQAREMWDANRARLAAEGRLSAALV